MTTRPFPRIYVASLADYNDGRLHGAWIDPSASIELVQHLIERMLIESATPGAEEYAIHDYEDFGPLRLDEYEPIERVVQVAQGIARHGEAFAAWADYLGSACWDELDRFDDAYIGSYTGLRDYAEDLLFNFDIDPDPAVWAPEIIAPYVRFDLDAFAEGLRGLETICDGTNGSIHIFAP